MSTQLLAFALAMSCQLTAQAATRLAIVSSTDARDTGDLLTVQLSKIDGLELVERDEVNRVFSEKSFQGAVGATKELVKLGGTLSADGLLLVSRENYMVHVKLASTRTGVILLDLLTDSRRNTMPAWIEFVSKQVEPVLPKLALSPKDCVLLSFQGFHDVAPTAGSSEMETTLNLGVMNTLSRQARVLVLERANMHKLVWETQWGQTATNDFVTPHAIVSGSIECRETAVTVNLKIARKGKEDTPTVQVQGTSDKTDQLIGKIAEIILQALPEAGTPAQWNAAEESKRLYDLATWASRHNLVNEAIAACESASALGMHTVDLERLRIYLYADLASPDPYPGGYPFQYIDVRADERPLLAAERSMELLRQYFRTYGKNTPWRKYEPQAVAGRTIRLVSNLIRVHVDDGMAAKRRERLDALRKDIREIMEPLIDKPPEGYCFESMFAFVVLYSPYWYDTPEEVMAMCRKTISRTSDAQMFLMKDVVIQNLYLRKSYLCEFKGYPKLHERVPGTTNLIPLVAWNGESSDVLAEKWKLFCKDLCSSKKPIEVLWGEAMAKKAGMDPATFSAGQDECDMIWQTRESLLKKQPRASWSQPAPSLTEIHEYEKMIRLSRDFRYKLATNLLEQPPGVFVDPQLLTILLDPKDLAEEQARHGIETLVDYRQRNEVQTNHPSLDAHMMDVTLLIGRILSTRNLKNVLQVGITNDVDRSITPKAVEGNICDIEGRWGIKIRSNNLILLDLETFENKIIPLPASGQSAGKNTAPIDQQDLLLIRSGHVFRLCDSVLQDYRIKEGSWKQTSLESLQYKVAWRSPYLYLAFNSKPVGVGMTMSGLDNKITIDGGTKDEKIRSGMFRYNAENGELETLFNSRRRPSVAATDNIAPQQWLAAGAAAAGEVWCASDNGIFRILPEPIGKPAPIFSVSADNGDHYNYYATSNGVLAYVPMITVPQDGLVHRSYHVSPKDGKATLLTANQYCTAGGYKYNASYRQLRLREEWKHPRWNLPAELSRKLPQEKVSITPSMIDDCLAFYTVRRKNDLVVGLHHSVYWFEPGIQEPVNVPVRIPADIAKLQALLKTGSIALTEPRNVGVRPFDNGWLIDANALGLWFLSAKDVQEWIRKQGSPR